MKYVRTTGFLIDLRRLPEESPGLWNRDHNVKPTLPGATCAPSLEVIIKVGPGFCELR